MRGGHHITETSGSPGGGVNRDSMHTGMGGTRREVDHLVKEIKENLKLGSAEHQLAPPPPSLGGGKIKAGGAFKARSSFSHRVCAQRASPYHVPPSSRQCDSASGGAGGAAGGPAEGNGMAATLSMRRKQRWGRRRYPSTCMNNNKFVGPEVGGGPDDPFAMLQELISDGSLIKEAVRRLQMDPADSADAAAFPPAGRLTPGSGNNRASGRQTAYDSDSDNEDCRTPPEVEDEETNDDVHVVQQETVSVATVGGVSGHANGSGSVVARSVTRTFPCCEVGL